MMPRCRCHFSNAENIPSLKKTRGEKAQRKAIFLMRSSLRLVFCSHAIFFKTKEKKILTVDFFMLVGEEKNLGGLFKTLRFFRIRDWKKKSDSKKVARVLEM